EAPRHRRDARRGFHRAARRSPPPVDRAPLLARPGGFREDRAPPLLGRRELGFPARPVRLAWPPPRRAHHEPAGADGVVLVRRRLVDLSHPIEPGMTTYPGLPGPVVSDFLSREASRGRYADGTTFQIARVEMVANTGTYVDAPFHRFAEGPDVGSLPLEHLADLEGVVIDRTDGRAFDADLFEGRELEGKAVLQRSGWDAHWR